MWPRLLLAPVLLAALVLSSASVPLPAAAANCQFILGFKAIHDLIPDAVGSCTSDEYHNAQNGDGLQNTTAWHGKGGLLVWRKCDNWTAFTDGASTWINGPNGLQKRANSARFPWEKDCPGQPTAATAPAPTTPAPSAPNPAAASAPTSYYWHPRLIQITPDCDKTYMHGHVRTADGHTVDGISIKTWNNWGNAEIVKTGTAPTYESGRWLRILNRDNNPQKWYAAVVDGAGRQASETAIMEFKVDCSAGPQGAEVDFTPD